ncbi:MAG: restriction endonuclease subunit R [Candidatus Magasanikbacteria bacterium]|nr:restriction endonuclease subunit R [Candidatus Magasanikbacteria bacterium]
MAISNISHGNKALEFIDSRIRSEKYRGSRSSQHNRYVMNQIIDILTLLDKHSPNQAMMTIRTTDISKRPQNTPEEFIYAQFCDEAKQKAGIGTQDAMRKNLFVDIHRMGFIERYDKNKNPIDPFSQHSVKYVSISNQGLKLINAKNILDKYFIFSKGIDTLLGGYIDTLLDILRDKEYGIEKISIYEYMFFVSAINTETSFNINIDQAIDLIKAYRTLTPIQRKSVIETLKNEMKPKNYNGTKINKRDFHNWHNKAEQVFYLLNQTVYFERRGEQLVLKKGQNCFTNTDTRLDRSLNEKYQYFVNHGVSKTSGFELHHVVPLAWSENIHHFKMLDRWENMVYIDAFSHAKITQNKNRNIILEIIKDDIKLSDYSNNEVYLKNVDNILYKTTNQDKMKNYNIDLLTTIK